MLCGGLRCRSSRIGEGPGFEGRRVTPWAALKFSIACWRRRAISRLASAWLARRRAVACAVSLAGRGTGLRSRSSGVSTRCLRVTNVHGSIVHGRYVFLLTGHSARLLFWLTKCPAVTVDSDPVALLGGSAFSFFAPLTRHVLLPAARCALAPDDVAHVPVRLPAMSLARLRLASGHGESAVSSARDHVLGVVAGHARHSTSSSDVAAAPQPQPWRLRASPRRLSASPQASGSPRARR